MTGNSSPIEHLGVEAAHAAKCELAETALRNFGSLRLQANGFSMLPSVRPGDLLLIHRSEIGDIALGDIVLYAREGKLVVHRVIARMAGPEGTRLITKGDALPSEDSAVSATELLGKVCLIFRGGECIEPRTLLSRQTRLAGALLSHSPRFAAALVRWCATWRNRGRKREVPCER